MQDSLAEMRKYSGGAMLWHWLHALLVATLFILGYVMTDLPRNTPLRGQLFSLHKSFGLIALALFVVRLSWRATHPAPALPSSLPRWQRVAAAASHHLLYLCLVLQPLTGFATTAFGNRGLEFFRLTLLQKGWDHPFLRELFANVHATIAAILLTIVAVHVLAALRHALQRDGIFGRMLPIRAR